MNHPRPPSARTATHHLVVLHRAYLTSILAGEKTFECRLSRTRRPPFRRVKVRDILWLKESGGPIRGTAVVTDVHFFHPFSPTQLTLLQKRYPSADLLDRAYLADHPGARYATILHLGCVHSIEPFWIRKNNRHAWWVPFHPPWPRTALEQSILPTPSNPIVIEESAR